MARCSFEPGLVFATPPAVGQRLCSFAPLLPRCLGGRMAAGSLSAASGFLERPPFTVELGRAPHGLCGGPVRPFHEDPEWIGELADSLPFREVLRYRFKRAGHNVAGGQDV